MIIKYQEREKVTKDTENRQKRQFKKYLEKKKLQD